MDKYICPLDLDFTNLTSGTVYFSLFNNNGFDIGINKISIQTMSATGSGNTKCMYAVARAVGSNPTGGTAVAYTKMDTDTPDLILDIRKSDAGLSTTGVVIDPYFMEVAIRTGSDGHQFIQTYDDDYGLVLYPTQGIVIIADGAGISGASIHGSVEFNRPNV